jgi:hypothetical protein
LEGFSAGLRKSNLRKDWKSDESTDAPGKKQVTPQPQGLLFFSILWTNLIDIAGDPQVSPKT